MIHLYLVRHAAAEDGVGIPDAFRTLNAKARKRFRKTARNLARKVGRLDLVLTSPLVRAVQTAELLAGEIKHGALAVLPELGADHTADSILKAVSRVRKEGSIALVGHEPHLGRLVAALARLSGAQAAKLEIRPGAIVRVDLSGLPQPKKADARWWIKSGPRHKGLPWKEETKPARKKKAAGVSATATKKTSKVKPVKKKTAPRKTAAAKVTRPPPPKVAAAPAPQRFMGSPRPPPKPAAAPGPAAPPLPIEKPPSGE
jgi:phosphohistidine phosphatase